MNLIKYHPDIQVKINTLEDLFIKQTKKPLHPKKELTKKSQKTIA